jgi:CubicO group peptidase (beta-lactamase class C family)
VEPTVSPLPLAATPLQPSPTPQSLAEELDSHLNLLSERNIFRGSVLVAKDGEIILSKGYGLADLDNNIPNTSQTKFRIASVTKQFTAMGVLILQSQGQLNVTDRICEYIPDCPMDWDEITIHHLLTHTSGIPHIYELAIDALELRPDLNLTPLQKFELIMDKALFFQPGESYWYSDTGYAILGYVIEYVSGQSYEDFLKEKIFEPLQMRDTGLDQKEEILAIGYTSWVSTLPVNMTNVDYMFAHAAFGLYSSVEDLFRWEQSLYTEQLVPQELLDMMFTAHLPIRFGGHIAEDGMNYGYGWFMDIGEEHNRRVFHHTGWSSGFLSAIWRYPDDKVTIIVLTNEEWTDLMYVLGGIQERVFRE